MEANSQVKNQTMRQGEMLQDRYRIERVLGANGLSITYEVTDTFRRKKMAIKELFPKAIVQRNADDRKRVELILLSNEAFFQKMCENTIKKAKKMIKLYPLEGMSNVVHYFEENRTVYIVMEFVEGIDFPTFIQKRGGLLLSLEKTVEMLEPMMRSLQKIHKAGLVKETKLCYAVSCTLGGGNKMEKTYTET